MATVWDVSVLKVDLGRTVIAENIDSNNNVVIKREAGSTEAALSLTTQQETDVVALMQSAVDDTEAIVG